MSRPPQQTPPPQVVAAAAAATLTPAKHPKVEHLKVTSARPQTPPANFESASSTNLPGLASGSSAKIQGKSRGKQSSEEGFEPYFPVVLVPGFGSSGLVAETTYHKSWEGERVWLAFDKPEFQWFKRMARRATVSSDPSPKTDGSGTQPDTPDSDNDEDSSRIGLNVKEEQENKSLWVRHLLLAADGVSDPPGLFFECSQSSRFPLKLNFLSFL